ncbi:hypothetical protein RJT34_08004 [Clitoria ternatea]|uniref:Uncharacterized protein n=1 Tax=Clitoria ternatea TaxID=43366 RepID=A0AAN9PVC7_CLITE
MDKYMRRKQDEKAILIPMDVTIPLEPIISSYWMGRHPKSGVQKVDAVGFSRGIWCLWNESLWAVEFIEASTQCIHHRNKEGDDRAWILSIVYAFPQPQTHVAFWDELRNVIIVGYGLNQKGNPPIISKTNFKFQSMRLAHERFDEEVKTLWKPEANLVANIEAFTLGV